MSIDENIQGIQIIKAQAEWDYPLDWQIVLDRAIDTMYKYQNLQNKLDQLEHEMELTLESDPRTMINRESDDGWLFDRIVKWRKIISEVVEDGKIV